MVYVAPLYFKRGCYKGATGCYKYVIKHIAPLKPLIDNILKNVACSTLTLS